MDIKIRRIIILIFAILFFISAPILILYASGFRYDIKRQKLIKTGNIFLETQGQSNITISLNNAKIDQELNKKAFIKNVIPDTYTISLEKPGYFPWQKKLAVYPSITTFATEILLFAQAKPQILSELPVEKIYLSPDGKNIVFTTNNDGLVEINRISLANPTPQLIYRLTENSNSKIQWTPSGEFLSITDETKTTLIENTSNPDLITIPHLITTPLLSQTSFEKKIYFVEKNKILDYSIIDKNSKTIYTSKGVLNQSISVVNDKIYFLETSKNSTNLMSVTIGNQVTPTIIATLPSNQTLGIEQIYKKYAIIKQPQTNSLTLVTLPTNNNSLNLKSDIITLDGQKIYISPKEDKLIIQNDFELHLLDLNTNSISIIERSSEVLKSAQWHPDGIHIIITKNSGITISDTSQNQEVENIKITDENVKIIDSALLDEDTIIYSNKSGLFIQELY